ncbi:MAG TPA: hypothetical protein VNZ48_00275 [Xanthobacteraceae bacterium]|jgi:hypothetical protein|nr:hypothetical protein [Xanthobacteraceae bacterium]
MAESLNPAASHHLPSFITPPGETDVLMVIMAIVLLLSVLGFGILFLRLHTLPERMAHRTHKLQFEIVAVLGLIALFTHQHIFWVAGLLLALIDLPDFGTMLGRIAGSVERMAGIKPGEGAAENSPDAAERSDKPAAEAHAGAKKSDGPPTRPLMPQTSRTNEKELDHA